MVSYKTKQRDGSWKVMAGPFKCDVAGVCEALKLQDMRVISGNMMACCPHEAHDDSDPSFGVSLNNGDFLCQGCGFKGSLIRLIRYIEKCDAQKAIWLARNAHANKFRGAVYESGPRRRQVRIYPESTLKEFQPNNPEYLLSRGIPEWAQDDWQVGYSKKQQRIFVPVRHYDGRLIGFDRLADEGLRRLMRRKSLYTPKLPVGLMVAGLDKIAGKRKFVILTEGTIDMLKVYAAIKRRNVGMIFGSSFNEQQARYLQRAGVLEVFTMFDNDEQGEKATKEVKDQLGKRLPVRPIKYEGADPGKLSLQDIHQSVVNTMKQ